MLSELALEREIHGIRAEILKRARASTSLLTEQDVRNALCDYAESPRENSASDANSPPAEISQEAYLFLERRLHNLRYLAISQAMMQQRKTGDSPARLSPDAVTRVLSGIVEDADRLQAAILTPDEWATTR
jgi:hypothetical protein